MGRQQLLWLFFGFNGRLGRQGFALAGLLLYLMRLFPFYRIMMSPDEATASFWAGIFLLVAGLTLASHVALAAKRLHDMNVSGWFSILFVIGDIIAYLVLCVIPGTQGPNRYGDRPNAPA